MNNRKSRLPEIIDILTRKEINSQEELAAELAKRGYHATQATLSRDLKILNAVKHTDTGGTCRYLIGDGASQRRPTRGSVAAPAYSLSEASQNAVLSIALTGSLAVIKTRNGYASGLAYDIDMMDSEYILGTIPGSDTVFVALEEMVDRKTLFHLFAGILPPVVMAAAHGYFFPGEDKTSK